MNIHGQPDRDLGREGSREGESKIRERRVERTGVVREGVEGEEER